MKKIKPIIKSAKLKKTSSIKILRKQKALIHIKKLLLYSGVLLIGLYVSVLATKDRQIITQYAATPTTPVISIKITPTFGCLGTTCTGKITPTGITPKATASAAPIRIVIPVNPNGKTPPGLINSFSHRLRNWLSKYIRFGGHPPGNPNIPGTNINPLASGSGSLTPIVIKPGKGNTGGIIIIATRSAMISPPPNQQNPLQQLINLIQRIFRR